MGLPTQTLELLYFKTFIANCSLVWPPLSIASPSSTRFFCSGITFLGWMSIQYYQRHKQHWKVNYKIKIFAWCLFALSTLLGLFSFWDYARYIPHEVWHSDTYYFTGRSINEFMQGWLSTFSLGCLLFLFLDRQQRMG